MALSLVGALLAGSFAFVLSNQKLNKLGSVDALDCSHNHVNHYSEVAPTLETSGVAEYWVCCDCHTSFKDEGLTEAFANTSGSPSDPSDGRYLAPFGEATEVAFIGDSFYSSSATVSAEPAPAGYAFTKVYQFDGNIRNIFDNYAVVDGFTKISFAAKTSSKYFSCRGDWAWSGGSWKIFELVQTAPGTWDIYGATAGNALTLRHSSISNRILSANSNANADSILNFTCENDTCYVTNFRVIREGEFASIDSAHFSDTATVSAEPAPTGYSFTKVYQVTNASIGTIFNSNANVDGLTRITFAAKTASKYFASHGWGDGGWSYSPSWKVFELIKTGADTWDIYTETTAAGYNVGLVLKGSGSGHTLSAILQLSCDPDTCYVTNLRVSRVANSVIAETAVAGSESVNDMHSSFLQFDQVSKKSLPENQGQPFIVNPNLDGVAAAEFAFLTKNRSFCDNAWGVALDKDTWFLAKFTINGANDVSCSIYAADGTLKFSYANKASFAAALPYYNYSGENLMEFYCTESRATLA